jgi:putative redox protein
LKSNIFAGESVVGVKSSGEYLGEKKVRLTHLESGAQVITVAPKDNNGDGSLFSPTDLVASALGSCMMTVMAIAAERKGISLTTGRFLVEKTMQTSPRRIKRLDLRFELPSSLSSDDRMFLEAAANSCPVHHSLHSDIECVILFSYTL